jgi:hypothetical protein
MLEASRNENVTESSCVLPSLPREGLQMFCESPGFTLVAIAHITVTALQIHIPVTVAAL